MNRSTTPSSVQNKKHAKKFYDFRYLSNQIIRLTSENYNRVKFLKKLSNILINFLECDAVELWIKRLRDENKCELIRKTKNTYFFKIIPCFFGKNKSKKNQSDEKLPLIEFYRQLVHGRFDSSLPYITANGSFWANDTKNPDDYTTLFKKYPHINKSTMFTTYKSVVILPFIIGEERLGLLQLKSKEKNFFTTFQPTLLEEFAHTLGIILINQSNQSDLQERVKELTCLYGISKIVEKPDTTIEEILQAVVELLPPAWQYPENTCARILYNDQSFTSPGYEKGKQKQTADIFVRHEKVGTLEVIYKEKEPERDEGPFLKEERNLINLISGQISLIIERKIQSKEHKKLEKQLQHADRLATLGQLSAGVAHELNEPLGTILGFAQLIQKCSVSENIKQDIDKIINASLHAREVIKKLLFFSKQMPPQKSKVNLNRIIQEGLYFLESRCAKNNITIKRELTESLPEIDVDPSQLHQVLVNLVVNAIQAMEKGGTLTIKTSFNDDSVFLIVKDTGCGMEETVIKKIFLPFYTTKDIDQGTGIGLSVVHGIIKSHNGSIDVKSQIDKGTEFIISLPRNS